MHSESLVAFSVLRNGHLCFDSVLRRCSCVWDVLLTDVVNAPCVVHPILQAPRLFATLLLVPPLSATVPRDHNSSQSALRVSTFRWVRGSLSSELRLAIRRHLPRVGGIGSHANGT